jgi:recombination protein RecA
MSDNQMGLQARLMGKALRKITAKAAENKTLVLFVNQIREKVGIVYGSPEVTSGGRALGFYSSVRIKLRKKEDLKSKTAGDPIGIKVRAEIVKNKLAPPLRVAELDILYGQGIDRYGCMVDLALMRGVLDTAAGWIKWAGTGEVFARSRDAGVRALTEDEALLKDLTDAINAPPAEVVVEPAELIDVDE